MASHRAPGGLSHARRLDSRAMPSTALTFPGASGATLAARLDLPADARPVAWALFAHCFTCSKDLKAAVRIARELNRHGLAVLRFDFTGLGESGGAFGDTTFSSNVDDLLAACRFLSDTHTAPALLVGHSLGGAAVLQAARQLPTVRAVATIGAPYDPAHVKHLFAEATDAIRARGDAVVRIAGREFTITRRFLEDLDATRVDEVVRHLGRALLIMHSPTDQVVGIDNAARLYLAARHPKSFISLDTADHLLTDPNDARYAATVLGAWASRYVGQRAPLTRETVARGPGIMAAVGGSGYRTDIVAGPHALVADEPEDVGGTDAGPTPYDLLGAALGACTAMTLRMYADRKRWPLGGVDVTVAHRRVHADDEAACESAPAKVDLLERSIRLAGTLDDTQQARLLEIADRCPVHRTLEAGARIQTTLDTGTPGEDA